MNLADHWSIRSCVLLLAIFDAGMMMPDCNLMAMMEGPGSMILGHVGQDAMTTPMSMPAMNHPPNTTNHIVNFSSKHTGGVHFLLCDGAVLFFSENAAYRIFRYLGQRNDGEVVGEF